MIYIINKNLNKVYGSFFNLQYAKDYINRNDIDENTIIYTEDFDMKYVSRTVYVDNIVVYNNLKFWKEQALNIIEDYDSHIVLDILNQPISKDRFIKEFNSNITRITEIDGRSGQISYNINIGNEFISLFREECILTNFTKESDTSPMIIFQKLDTVINMLQIGGFREARQYLQLYRAQIRDDFLTNERIDKYIAMLDAADAIQYATEEDYFYTAPESNNEGE